MRSAAAPARESCAMPDICMPAPVRAIGHAAARALAACGGRLDALAEFPDAPYRLAGETVVWVGAAGPMHPRAVFTATPMPPARVTVVGLTPWHAVPGAGIDDARRTACRGAFARLARQLAADAPDSGFAPLLAGRVPAFPLAVRHTEALAVVAAAGAGDAGAFVVPALRLIGAGPGLTPSGDDFVGGALFVRHHFGSAGDAWRDAACTLAAAAATRTHRIGAALLADLATGHSFAALHDLLDAACAGADADEIAARAHAVAAIGHSSGWDMLTGMLAAGAALPHHSAPD